MSALERLLTRLPCGGRVYYSGRWLVRLAKLWRSRPRVMLAYPPGHYASPLPDPAAMLQLSPHSSTPMEFRAYGGTAVAIISLCLLLPTWGRRLATPLAAVGAMSLTAYAGHVVMLYLWPDFFGNATTPRGNWPYAAMVAGLVAFALAWRFTLGRGPLEALLRSASLKVARID